MTSESVVERHLGQHYEVYLLLQGTNLRYSSILGLFFNCMLTMLIVLLTVLAVLLCQNQQRRKKYFTRVLKIEANGNDYKLSI